MQYVDEKSFMVTSREWYHFKIKNLEVISFTKCNHWWLNSPDVVYIFSWSHRIIAQKMSSELEVIKETIWKCYSNAIRKNCPNAQNSSRSVGQSVRKEIKVYTLYISVIIVQILPVYDHSMLAELFFSISKQISIIILET